MSTENTGSASTPRALVHKKILDEAASKPNAAISEIADAVSGASAELVERVLDQYGDPASDDTETMTETTSSDGPSNGTPDTEPTSNEGIDDRGAEGGQSVVTDDVPDAAEARTDDPQADETPANVRPADLTQKQRVVLEAVATRPGASQADIAEELDVTAPTVSRRVKDVPGFEWANRATFVRDLFGEEPSEAEADPASEDGERDETAAAATPDDVEGPQVAENPATPGDDTVSEAPAASEDATVPDGAGEAEPVSGSGTAADLEDLSRRVRRIERQVDGDGDDPRSGTGHRTEDEGREGPAGVDELDCELVHKVIHACMDSENVTEDEELRIIRALVDK